ncbi:SRPBCC family protein [Kitasatospora sp. NPDC093679]|uniref:SRPBCC family protein n=1 Tax=Kitasatospora sp. NPDC093679 TaxID=3154983 RepID=UPI00342EAD70
MARIVLTRRSPLAPAVCWERLTDWPRHGDRVPFTEVSVVHGSGRQAGDTILARTAVGPMTFDDPMEIVALESPGPGRPGFCRLEKRGRVVRGWAELGVRRRPGDSGTDVTWTEELTVAALPGALEAVVAPVGRVVFGRVLSHLLGPTEHGRRRHPAHP